MRTWAVGHAAPQRQAMAAAPLGPQGGGSEVQADGAIGIHKVCAGQGFGMRAGSGWAGDGAGPADGDFSGAAAADGVGDMSVAHAWRVAPTVPRWSGSMPLGLEQHAAFDSASSITAAAAGAGQVAPPSAGNNVEQGSSPPYVASGVTMWQQLMLPIRQNGTAQW